MAASAEALLLCVAVARDAAASSVAQGLMPAGPELLDPALETAPEHQRIETVQTGRVRARGINWARNNGDELKLFQTEPAALTAFIMVRIIRRAD
jgi:hypothetical protein